MNLALIVIVIYVHFHVQYVKMQIDVLWRRAALGQVHAGEKCILFQFELTQIYHLFSRLL